MERSNDSYLLQTLDSLLQSTSDRDKQNITIVVFLGDFNITKRKSICNTLTTHYSEAISSGLLVAISSHEKKYPVLDDPVKSYGDSTERIKWRTKQAVDFAILWKFSSWRSQYYLQLEDDIISVDGYFTAIRKYIDDVNKEAQPWVCLQFSKLGFIGKLFRAEDLTSLTKVVFMFYQHHPVDIILMYFLRLSVQKQGFVHNPALFQHIGKHSSLTNKTQKLWDETFYNSSKIYKGDNPPAHLTTNMVIWGDHNLEMAYSKYPGFFWARKIRAGQHVMITFERPQLLERVVVETGSKVTGIDNLRKGKIDAGHSNSDQTCTDFVYIGQFYSGRADITGLETTLKTHVHCLRIVVTGYQEQWLIISEIAIFVTKSNMATTIP